jgi:hypothetical protein
MKNPATRNRTRDHLIAAAFYSQMLYQLTIAGLLVIDRCVLPLDCHGRQLHRKYNAEQSGSKTRRVNILMFWSQRENCGAHAEDACIANDPEAPNKFIAIFPLFMTQM